MSLPGTSVHTCRSCTSVTPSTAASAARSSSTSMCCGDDSDRIRSAARASATARGSTHSATKHRDHDVGVGPVRRHRHDAGDQHPDAADGVGDDLHVGALDGQALSDCDRSSSTTSAVRDQPGQRHHDHRHARDLRRVAEPLERLVEDEDGDTEQQHRVGDRGEHLGAMPAVGARRRCRPVARQQHRSEPHEHGDQVGQHVPGVGQQGDRLDQQRGGQLDGEEDGQDRRGDDHPAHARVTAVAVVVSGTHSGNLCVKPHMSQVATSTVEFDALLRPTFPYYVECNFSLKPIVSRVQS